MKRTLLQSLVAWKSDSDRKPLLVRGARQVGKSYLVEEFGKAHFDHCVTVNFELMPELIPCFERLQPDEILFSMSAILGREIIPGITLLFLDEIQECPRAILALRYFYELKPDLHIIGAGSLLEFALKSEDISVPVGRIQYVFLTPMSFGEFLTASDQQQAYEAVTKLHAHPISPALHQHLLKLLKTYLIVGGMPAAVSKYLSTKNYEEVSRVQRSILQTYRDDFGKYSSLAKRQYLQKIFDAAPRLVGQKFKYSRVDRDVQSRDLKVALELLEQAGILLRVYKTSGGQLPLENKKNDHYFKIVFLDVGLMQNKLGMTADLISKKDVMSVYDGGVCEQFVGQELLAYRSHYLESQLFYWARDERGSSAEVDYLLEQHGKIIPIEVKAGPWGTLKSLRMFMEKYEPPFGLKISSAPFSKTSQLTSVPLYAVETMISKAD